METSPNSFASLVSKRRSCENLTNRILVKSEYNWNWPNCKRLVCFSLQLGSSQEGHVTGTECGSSTLPEARSAIKLYKCINVVKY